MIQLFSTLNPLTKLRNPSVDNVTFRLHYRVTVLILAVSSVLISTKQFFGEPIYCLNNKERTNVALESYCWIHGVFTFRQTEQNGRVGKTVVYPGVGPSGRNDVEVHHRYYQWVCIILFVQTLLFYFPHFLWKSWEGGRIKGMTKDLDNVVINMEKWNESLRLNLVKYISQCHDHYFYAIKFLICEILNLVNVVFQFFVLNKFLGGNADVLCPAIASLFYDPNEPDLVDPMAWIFPKVTKCDFKYYGSSGGIQNMDLICILPLNIFNEKVYALLWLWFIFLMVVTGITIVSRIVIFCCPCIRVYSLLGQLRGVPRYQVMNLIVKLNFGDWFFLHQLGKNMNPIAFKELIVELDREYGRKAYDI